MFEGGGKICRRDREKLQSFGIGANQSKGVQRKQEGHEEHKGEDACNQYGISVCTLNTELAKESQASENI